MKRWVYFSLSFVAAAALFAVGWLLPIHLRAVDSSVLQRAGEKTPGLLERGTSLANENKIGPAKLLLQAAQQEKISNGAALRQTIEASATAHPERQILGEEPHSKLFLDFAQNNFSQTKKPSASDETIPFTGLIIKSENRAEALEALNRSASPVVRQLLRCRTLTNTVLFPPSQSASGQAFDATVATCGLLIEEQHLSRGLSDEISSSSLAALRGESSKPLEQILLDVMSLGQRLNWGQLAAFCEKIESAETLRLLANFARKEDAQLPVLFSAVELSGNPAGVAKYLLNFSETGQKDLAASLRFGEGGVSELLRHNQRLHESLLQGKLNGVSAGPVHLAWQKPRLALALKWYLYFAAGFMLALALHFAKPQAPVLERPLQVRGVHVAREILFGLGFLLVVLLLSEPFLAQGSQRVEMPFRLRLPMVGVAAPAGTPASQTTFMNPEVLITMSIFFVLQSLLYIMCLVKLAEIRRQKVAPRIKLRLLENEDHLFDSGLYLGFLGTIVSFVLTSIHVFEHLNLMAAYSATSFGILFVVLFKVVHLRPARRKLLLEAETIAAEESAAPVRPVVSSL
jgi:hypothetical protein